MHSTLLMPVYISLKLDILILTATKQLYTRLFWWLGNLSILEFLSISKELSCNHYTWCGLSTGQGFAIILKWVTLALLFRSLSISDEIYELLLNFVRRLFRRVLVASSSSTVLSSPKSIHMYNRHLI